MVIPPRSTRSRIALCPGPPDERSAPVVEALISKARRRPAILRKTLTGIRGNEQARYEDFSVATDVQAFSCDPRSPRPVALDDRVRESGEVRRNETAEIGMLKLPAFRERGHGSANRIRLCGWKARLLPPRLHQWTFSTSRGLLFADPAS